MKITLLLILVAFTFRAGAQQFYNEKVTYQLKIEKYKRMKNTGIVMIVAGTVAMVVGISDIGSATYTTNPSTGQTTTSDPKAITGALLTVAGLGLLGGGIPLTIIGAHTSKKYQRKFDALVLHLKFNPQHQGLALSYKF